MVWCSATMWRRFPSRLRAQTDRTPDLEKIRARPRPGLSDAGRAADGAGRPPIGLRPEAAGQRSGPRTRGAFNRQNTRSDRGLKTSHSGLGIKFRAPARRRKGGLAAFADRLADDRRGREPAPDQQPRSRGPRRRHRILPTLPRNTAQAQHGRSHERGLPLRHPRRQPAHCPSAPGRRRRIPRQLRCGPGRPNGWNGARTWLREQHLAGVILVQIRAYPLDLAYRAGDLDDPRDGESDDLSPGGGGLLADFMAGLGDSMQWATTPLKVALGQQRDNDCHQ